MIVKFACHDLAAVFLFPTVVLCGIIQVFVGLLRLGKLIRLVPHPVMLGFVNGLAIVICLAQIASFQTFDKVSGRLQLITGMPLIVMLTLVAITMAISLDDLNTLSVWVLS